MLACHHRITSRGALGTLLLLWLDRDLTTSLELEASYEDACRVLPIA